MSAWRPLIPLLTIARVNPYMQPVIVTRPSGARGERIAAWRPFALTARRAPVEANNKRGAMYIIVDDRNIVTGGYASSFDREGVTTTGIDPIEFSEWLSK